MTRRFLLRELIDWAGPRYTTAEVTLPLLIGCALSLLNGTDNNWDLRTYHLYNPFALLDGRLARDLLAASGQSYYNPLLDVPYYWLSVRLIPSWPRLVALLAGMPYGVLAIVVLRLARIVLPGALGQWPWLAIIAATIGLTGTAALSEVGTTFGDIPVTILILGGLIVPMSLLRRPEAIPGHWLIAVASAGLLAGIAAGLKLVACVFAPGAALGLAMATGNARRFVMTGAIFSLLWAVGFAIAFGPWGLTVTRMFGNPVFPYYNDIFASPWYPGTGGLDDRFLPHTIWQALFFPLFWLRGRDFVVAEVGVRDPRFAFAWLSLLVLCVLAVRRRGRSDVISQPAAMLCIFFAVSFVLWEAMFGILRYAMPLEVVTGILMTLVTLALLKVSDPIRASSESRIVAVIAILLIAVFAVSSRPGWGRLRNYGTAVFDVRAPRVPDHSAVVFMGSTMAFVAPFLEGNDLVFLGVSWMPDGSMLEREIKRRIQVRPVIMAVVHGTVDEDLAERFGFRILSESCVPIVDSHQRDLRICAGEHIGTRS